MEKKEINFSYFFLLGQSEEPFENESDFIVGEFVDTYDNLILKTKTAYEYFERFCPSARFFLLIDDDVSFNPTKIIKKLKEKKSKNVIFGKRWNRTRGKYFKPQGILL